jgi:hypothetical protein
VPRRQSSTSIARRISIRAYACSPYTAAPHTCSKHPSRERVRRAARCTREISEVAWADLAMLNALVPQGLFPLVRSYLDSVLI